MFYQKNIENFRIYDIEIQKIINSHYYYICCLIILLSYKLSKTKIDIERKKSLLLKIMRQNYSCFFAISGIRDKKWKRVLFGSILLIFPYYGALISEKIINELR